MLNNTWSFGSDQPLKNIHIFRDLFDEAIRAWKMNTSCMNYECGTKSPASMTCIRMVIQLSLTWSTFLPTKYEAIFSCDKRGKQQNFKWASVDRVWSNVANTAVLSSVALWLLSIAPQLDSANITRKVKMTLQTTNYMLHYISVWHKSLLIALNTAVSCCVSCADSWCASRVQAVFVLPVIHSEVEQVALETKAGM